jgi:hypothetical protein
MFIINTERLDHMLLWHHYVYYNIKTMLVEGIVEHILFGLTCWNSIPGLIEVSLIDICKNI